jgi:hypothetical protein
MIHCSTASCVDSQQRPNQEDVQVLKKTCAVFVPRFCYAASTKDGEPTAELNTLQYQMMLLHLG